MIKKPELSEEKKAKKIEKKPETKIQNEFNEE